MVHFAEHGDAYAKVDTVAFVEVKDEQPLKICTGYLNDGHDTDDEVDLRSATLRRAVRRRVADGVSP